MPLVIIMNDNMGLAVIVAMNSINTYGVAIVPRL